MAAEELESARWQTLMWQPRIGDRTVDFPVPVLVSDAAANHPDMQVHHYQPMGQGRWAARQAMGVMARHGLAGVVVDVRYHQLPPDQIGRIVRELPLFVVEQVANGNAVDMEGGSIGAVPVVVGSAEAPELCNSVGVVSPAGYLNELMGETPEKRRKYVAANLGWENTKRTVKGGLDFGDFVQVLGIVHVLARHRLNGQLLGSIDGAADPVLAPLMARSTQTLVDKGIPVRLLAPENDPLCPAHWYDQVLGEIGCAEVIQLIPGLHTTVRSSAGAEQYGILAAWTKAQQDARILATQ